MGGGEVGRGEMNSSELTSDVSKNNSDDNG